MIPVNILIVSHAHMRFFFSSKTVLLFIEFFW